MKKLPAALAFLASFLPLMALGPAVGSIVSNPYSPPFVDCLHQEVSEREHQLKRIQGSLSHDGLAFLALARQADCGNSSCWWSIFIKKDGRYIYVGQLSAGVMGVLPIKKPGLGRIRTYSPAGSQSGFYAVYDVSEKGIQEVSGKNVSAEADGPLYDQLFRAPTKVWLPEESGQCANGKVEWPSP